MNSKGLFKGFLGSFILGLFSAVIWGIIACLENGRGSFISPLFGILIPLGYYWFSKKRPTEKKSWLIMGLSLLLSVVIGIYLDMFLNSYALFLEYNGFNPDGIYLSDVRRYVFDSLKDKSSPVLMYIIDELARGVIISTLFGGGMVYLFKRKEGKQK